MKQTLNQFFIEQKDINLSNEKKQELFLKIKRKTTDKNIKPIMFFWSKVLSISLVVAFCFGAFQYITLPNIQITSSNRAIADDIGNVVAWDGGYQIILNNTHVDTPDK